MQPSLLVGVHHYCPQVCGDSGERAHLQAFVPGDEEEPGEAQNTPGDEEGDDHEPELEEGETAPKAKSKAKAKAKKGSKKPRASE